jgi:hypothetical protein
MTLPSSGSLDYNSIRAEFGSPSSNVYLNLYYRGGPYTYPVPANASITTSSSGQLSVSNFYGADGTTDYAKMIGASHNTGGKAPVIYNGVSSGGVGTFGSMPDGSMKVGSSSYTISAIYASGVANMVMIFNSGYGDSQFRSRRFYFYNTSGGLAAEFSTGHKAGYTGTPDIWQSPNPTGTYSEGIDAGLSGPAPFGSNNTPGQNCGMISGSAPGFLNATLFIKAF